MKYYKAIIIEKGKQEGSIIGNTKNGKYKGMNKAEFEEAVKKDNAFTFKVEEIHRNAPTS
jgi:hypothetical protein